MPGSDESAGWGDTVGAKQAIVEVLYRYCYAVDRVDPAMTSQIWHPDAVADYDGVFQGSGRDLMAWVFEQHRACEATSHQLANPLVEVDGDRASSESYVTACVRAGGNDIVVRGRYRDTWSRRQGEWRIDSRRFDRDMMQVIPSGGVAAS